MKKNIDIKDIIDWVLENKDNQSDIDMLSHLIYPYTTKYKKYYCRQNNDRDGYSKIDDGDVNVTI